MKRMIIVFMLVVMLFSLTVVADSTTTEEIIVPSERFIELCDNLFNFPEIYKAVDKNGVDVTYAFVEKYQKAFQTGNYMVLFTAYRNELYCIKWQVIMDEIYATDGTGNVTTNGRIGLNGKRAIFSGGMYLRVLYYEGVNIQNIGPYSASAVGYPQ